MCRILSRATTRIARHASLWLFFGLTGIALAAENAPDGQQKAPQASSFALSPDKPVTPDKSVTKMPKRVAPPPGPALMAPMSGGASTSTVPLKPDASKLKP